MKHFLHGIASTFDITGRAFIGETKGERELSDFQKDYQALYNDWKKLGDDMRKAMNTVSVHGKQ